MATTELLIPDIQALEQGAQTQALELAYEKILRKSDLVYEAEKTRVLRVEMVLLEDDNNDLHLHLSLADDRVDGLEKSEEELQINLQAAELSLEGAQADLRSRCKEVENLRTELTSLNDVSINSTKLLTEKLALSRELASLRPELEHFRSQVVLHQSTLAEKLILQRQLSSAQVELQTERNATQRALAKEGGRQELTEKMETQLDALQLELVQERRERLKAERELQRITTDFEGRKAVMETRLEAFRNKLRVTKDQLKEAQVELQKSRNQKMLSDDLNTATLDRSYVKESRKRSLTQADTDATIGTPGILPPAKKGKQGSTIPGDKSTFSITPYLNRTTSVAPESPTDGETVPGHKHKSSVSDKVPKGRSNSRKNLNHSEKPTSTSVDQTSDSGAPPKKCGVLTTANAGKSNPRAISGRTMKRTALEQVHEEIDEENDGENLPPMDDQGAPPLVVTEGTFQDPQGFANEETTFIKKKRKLLGAGLGRTLFDDDDGVIGKGHNQTILKTSHAFRASGKEGLSTTGPLLAGTGSSQGLGAFSPLKKDRKMIRK